MEQFLAIICCAAIVSSGRVHAEESPKPNLVYILCDDLGYGDVSALNPEGRIKTPNFDRLAAEGMIFTDAHTSSSVCTPTRYNVLTGRYNWRTRLKKGVLYGYDGPLIAEDRLTLASLCRDKGYHTAMFGKWHLGMELPFIDEGGSKKEREIDWSAPIKRTPVSNGFDYFWGHAASLDMPPYVYIENDHYTSTDISTTEQRGYAKIAHFRGGIIADDFNPHTTLDEICDRTADYIRKADKSKPFCIYVPLTSPHTPILPSDEWQGKSGIGSYGDFVLQTDAAVGRILNAIDEEGIKENTIIVFTSDNGCSRAAGITDMEEMGHHPSYIYRGSKSDIWDGGHRVPHIVRWPAKIKAGSKTDRLTVLGDIVATMADIVGVEIPDDAAEDSISYYPALLGKKDPTREHEAIVNHSIQGNFAIRTPEWKLAFCPGSGGWSSPNDKEARKQGLPEYQLYNMKDDRGETTNLYGKYPEVEKNLTAILTRYIEEGRSRPGAPQPNDTPNDWLQLDWMKGNHK